MDNTTKLLLEKLKARSQTAIDCNEDLDAVFWGLQEGVLISCNDAKLIIELIEKSESKYASLINESILKTKK